LKVSAWLVRHPHLLSALSHIRFKSSIYQDQIHKSIVDFPYILRNSPRLTRFTVHLMESAAMAFNQIASHPHTLSHLEIFETYRYPTNSDIASRGVPSPSPNSIDAKLFSNLANLSVLMLTINSDTVTNQHNIMSSIAENLTNLTYLQIPVNSPSLQLFCTFLPFNTSLQLPTGVHYRK